MVMEQMIDFELSYYPVVAAAESSSNGIMKLQVRF
jgi:hypothetical protein